MTLRWSSVVDADRSPCRLSNLTRVTWRDRTRRPMQSEFRVHGRSVGLNAAGKTHKRTQSTGSSVGQPVVKVAYALTDNQTAKALKQLVAGSDRLIVGEHVLECFAFVLLQLVRWSLAAVQHQGTIIRYKSDRDVSPPARWRSNGRSRGASGMRIGRRTVMRRMPRSRAMRRMGTPPARRSRMVCKRATRRILRRIRSAVADLGGPLQGRHWAKLVDSALDCRPARSRHPPIQRAGARHSGARPIAAYNRNMSTKKSPVMIHVP
jgi:hypothetical protein